MKKFIVGLLMMSPISSVFASEHCERINSYLPSHQKVWSALSELDALGDLTLPISRGVLLNNLWQIQLHEKSGVDSLLDFMRSSLQSTAQKAILAKTK